MSIYTCQCQQKDHSSFPITAMCFNMECTNNRLCCQLCLIRLHNTHKQDTISLLFIEQFLLKEPQKIKIPNLQHQFDEFKQTILELLANLEKLIKQWEKHFTIIDSLNAILQKYFRPTNIPNSEVHQLYYDLIQIIRYTNNTLQFKHSQDLLKKQTIRIYEDIYKLSKEQEKSLHHLQFLLTQPGFKFQFSQNKHKDIQLINSSQIRSKLCSSVNALAYLDQSFDSDYESIRLEFKILNLTSGMWIGLGIYDQQRHQNYTINNYKQPNHGLYFMANQKYIGHDSNVSYNMKALGFYFTTNDQIILQYKCYNRKLVFRKANSREKFTMFINQKYKELFPIIGFFGPNDEVELIQ